MKPREVNGNLGSARGGAVMLHWSICGSTAAAKAQASAHDLTQASLAVMAVLAASAVQSPQALAGSALHAYLSTLWTSGIVICLRISSTTGSASAHFPSMIRSRPLMNWARILTFTVAGPVLSPVKNSSPHFSASSQISLPRSVTAPAAVAAT